MVDLQPAQTALDGPAEVRAVVADPLVAERIALVALDGELGGQGDPVAVGPDEGEMNSSFRPEP